MRSECSPLKRVSLQFFLLEPYNIHSKQFSKVTYVSFFIAFSVLMTYNCKQIQLTVCIPSFGPWKSWLDFFNLAYSKSHFFVVYSCMGFCEWEESHVQHNSAVQNTSVIPRIPFCCPFVVTPLSVPTPSSH